MYIYTAAHQGESILDILNHLDLDYFTLGNHEFDFGANRVGELMRMSNFKWLGKIEDVFMNTFCMSIRIHI
jgi:2',3'-cyclic-nucleotide 2'-phosphodiesterase (5'-nucleotidase family)